MVRQTRPHLENIDNMMSKLENPLNSHSPLIVLRFRSAHKNRSGIFYFRIFSALPLDNKL